MSFLVCTLILLGFQSSNGLRTENNNSSSFASTSTSSSTTPTIQTSILESENPCRFAIDIEINIHFSSNSSLDTYENKSVFLEQLRQLIDGENLQQSFLLDVEWNIETNTLDTNHHTLNLRITVDTDNEDDLSAIIKFIHSEEFQQSLKNIQEQTDEDIIVLQIEVVSVDYEDNEETQLDWTNPLKYNTPQWIVVGAVFFIVCSFAVVVCVYCLLCNAKTRKVGDDPIRYEYGLRETDGMPRSFNNRSAVQLGKSSISVVQYVD